MSRKVSIAVSASLVTVVLSFCALVAGCSPGVLNRPAPAFKASLFDGGTVTLSNFKGKLLVLNFWASWCPPCVAEMPAVQRAWEKYSKKGVNFLAIATEDTRKDAVNFLRANKIRFPVAYDEDSDAILRKYQGRGLPSTYFINRHGVVVDRHTGYISEELLTKKLDRLLASK